MIDRFCRRLHKCVLTVFILFASELVSAATAEAMGQAVMYVVLYAFVLILPIPFSFLLAAYSQYLRNTSSEFPKFLNLVSMGALVFGALIFLVLIFQSHIVISDVWQYVYIANAIAMLVIAILGFNLIGMGHKFVVLALLPISAILTVICFVIIRLAA